MGFFFGRQAGGEIQRKKNLDGELRREEEEEGDLQTCTSIPPLNLIVIQAICPPICDMEYEVWRVLGAP